MTLNEVMKETADAIREKTGKSELIAPVNFAEEIKGITSGGGESGESNWRYFATSNNELLGALSTLPILVRGYDYELNNIQIASPEVISNQSNFQLMAIAYDMNLAIYLTNPIDPEEEPLTTVGDVMELYIKIMGGTGFLGVEITKEKFYHIPDLSHDGAYIQHIDGTLYTADQWTNKGFSNDEANGIANINGTRGLSLVVAKDSLGKLSWSSMPDILIEGVTTITEADNLEHDCNGVENTTLIAAADTNSAAAACANYTFPNGQKGYLGAFGESFDIESIDTLLELIGGTPLGNVNIWTSTQYNAEKAWYNRVNGTYDYLEVPKSNNLEVRPICTLENYKFATN